jgi:hypothetical protein
MIIFYCILTSCSQKNNHNDFWISSVDTINDQYGYKDQSGKITIPFGKYSMCYTDTFKTYAIVLKPTYGFVAIDKKENVLYKVFPFDNGPDYSSNGLFRILENNLIGYADSLTGKIIINPQFNCAFPFENGVAKVSTDCKAQSDGEHSTWLSDYWFYIDKTGKKVDNPMTTQ